MPISALKAFLTEVRANEPELLNRSPWRGPDSRELSLNPHPDLCRNPTPDLCVTGKQNNVRLAGLLERTDLEAAAVATLSDLIADIPPVPNDRTARRRRPDRAAFLFARA